MPSLLPLFALHAALYLLKFVSDATMILKLLFTTLGTVPSPKIFGKVVALIRFSERELHKYFTPRQLSPTSISLTWDPPVDGARSLVAGVCGYRSSLECSSRRAFCHLARPPLVWEAGFKEVLCETDCHEAFMLLKDTLIFVCSEASDLILRIRELLHRPWRTEVVLIQRTANCVADALAKYAIKQGIHYGD
ncbi:hypothetical protein PIB30_074483 [Stylosanthes scabra]|uniref:RNase H type-1 domain-containing protein n=1 Tax=Stylosanthes scabra TaxID=79078 RepID=A0ABU6ZP03_9FABA|nr:hypothetical protein [Stylosanthes scabra]